MASIKPIIDLLSRGKGIKSDGWEDVPVDKAASDDGWEDVPVQPAENTGRDAYLEGLRQVVTSGTSDEFGSAYDAAKETVFGPRKYKDLLESYRQIRAGKQDKIAGYQKENPTEYYSGMGTGMGAQAAFAAGTGGLSLIPSVLLGALGGVANNPDPIIGGDKNDIISNVASGTLGALISGGTSALLNPSLGNLLTSSAKQLGRTAGKIHLRPTPQMAEKLGDEGLNEVVDAAYNAKAIEPFRTVKNTAKNLGESVDDIGQQLGAQREQIASGGAGVSPGAIRKAFTEGAESINEEGANQAAANRINRIGDQSVNKLSPSPIAGMVNGEDELKNYVFQGINEGAPDSTVDTGWWTKNIDAARGYAGPGGKINAAKISDFDPQLLLGDEYVNGGIITGSPSNISNTIPASEFSGSAGLAKKMFGDPASQAPKDVPFDKLAKLITRVQKKVNYNKNSNEFNEGLRNTAGNLRTVEKSITPAGDAGLYRSQMDKASNLYDALAMADKTGSLHRGGMMGRLQDIAINTDAASRLSQGDIKGIPLALVRAATKGRVSSTIGAGANAVSKMDSNQFAKIMDALERQPIASTASELGQRAGDYISPKQAADDYQNRR